MTESTLVGDANDPVSVATSFVVSGAKPRLTWGFTGESLRGPNSQSLLATSIRAPSHADFPRVRRSWLVAVLLGHRRPGWPLELSVGDPWCSDLPERFVHGTVRETKTLYDTPQRLILFAQLLQFALARRLVVWVTIRVNAQAGQDRGPGLLHALARHESWLRAGHYLQFITQMPANFRLRPIKPPRRLTDGQPVISHSTPVVCRSSDRTVAATLSNDSHVILLDGYLMSATWDGLRLAHVPSPTEAASVFDQVTVTCRASLGVSTVAQAVECLGWPVRTRRLSEAGSTIQSLLVPRLGGGFSIVLNADHNLTDSKTHWLMAHEFAHSLFYYGQTPPRRIIPHSPQEEDFCDAFAEVAARDAVAVNHQVVG